MQDQGPQKLLPQLQKQLEPYLQKQMQSPDPEMLTPQQKHQIWVKNSGYLYDRLLIQKLKWPSLTFQWLPSIEQSSTQTKYEFIYATHTSGAREVQSLHIGQVTFPKLREMSEDIHQSMPISKVKSVQKFTHESEINKARHFESNPNFIAARTDEGPISIFKRGHQFPTLILQGNLQEGGFALDWKVYGLITGDLSGQVLIWKDVEQKTKPCFQSKWKDKVEDTKWIDSENFCTVGDDGNLCMWDLRSGKVQQAVPVYGKSDAKEIYSCAINPENRFLIVTGGQDCTVRLWDSRSLKKKLHSFEGHDNSITTLDWSNVNTTMLASGGQDHKVKIWDLMRIGAQVPRDQSGLQQIVFTHEGHMGEVTDLGWNPHQMILGSTEQEHNTIQLYQITNYIQDIDYTEDIEYLKSQCFK